MESADTIARHERIALQFSGGRDSLACLYLLREYWHRLTVYWLNTGAAYPETLAQMAEIRALVPHFVEIDGRQPDVLAAFGIPSDIVPVSRTPLGIIVAGDPAQQIQDRYSCCARVMMLPMHERMLADGVTLIIRGQRDDDRLKSHARSGQVHDGIELLFPIEHWSAARVDAYLVEVGADVPRFYEMLESMPDCMTCSAWWENGSAAYLKRYHYPQFKIVQARLDVINQAVGEHIAHFNKEVAS